MSEELLKQVSKDKLVEALLEQREKTKELERLLTEVQGKGKKATEGQLDNLQGILAQVMAAQVEYTEEICTFNAEGEEVGSGVEQYTATPALLGVIEKFLKNNSIISDITTNENTETLQAAMKRKTKRSDRLPTSDKVVELMQQG